MQKWKLLVLLPVSTLLCLPVALFLPSTVTVQRVTVSIDATAEGRVAGPIGKISVIPVDPPSTPPEGYQVIAPFDFETDSTTRYASAGTCCVSFTVTVCSVEGTIDTETKIGYIYILQFTSVLMPTVIAT